MHNDILQTRQKGMIFKTCDCLVTSNLALANIVTGTCTTFKYRKATLNCVPDRS